MGVVASEVREEFRVFVEPQKLSDGLDGEDFRVAERRGRSACSEAPKGSVRRSSMRQKTATMKVLRSIRRRPPLRLWCYWLTPSVGRSFVLLKSSKKLAHRVSYSLF